MLGVIRVWLAFLLLQCCSGLAAGGAAGVAGKATCWLQQARHRDNRAR